MQRWMVAACLGLGGTLASSLDAQTVTYPFQVPPSWFVGPGGTLGVIRGSAPTSVPPLGQIAVDNNQDGVVDETYDLPLDIRNGTGWALQDRLSPTERVLYTRKFPTGTSSSVCDDDAANSQVFFHLLDTPPSRGMTLLGSTCLHGPLSRQPLFYDPPTPLSTPPRTAMIVAAPSGSRQSIGWFDLASGGVGVDGSNYEPNVSIPAEGVLVSPFGNAFYIRHRTSQLGLTPRYSIVDLCASPTGGVVTTHDEPRDNISPNRISVELQVDGGDLSAVVSFDDVQPPETQTFLLNNCLAGPPPTRERLSVITSGPGVVSSNPTGIASCGSGGGAGCQASFPPDTAVTLSATPLPGTVFLGWSGDCSGTSPTTQVLMTQNRTCQAAFGSVQLTISKTATPTSVAPGQTLTYTLSYSNTGNLNATGVTVVDALPAGSVFVAAPGGTPNGQTVTWNVGTLASGASGQVQLVVRAGCGSSLVNSAYSIASAQTAALPGVAVTTPISAAVLAPVTLQMTSVPDRLPLRSGDRIRHTLTLHNTGTANHPYLRMRFGIGDAVAFDAVQDPGTGTLAQLNAIDVEWVGALAAGATTSVVFTTIVVECFTFNETRFNNGGQPLRVQDFCGTQLASIPPAGPFPLERPVAVALEFVGLPVSAHVATHPGTSLDLRITLTNRFATDQPGVSISMVIPTSFELASDPFIPPLEPNAVWDESTRRVSWTGTLAGSSAVTITLRGTLAPAAPCRSQFTITGSRLGCNDLSRSVSLYAVPPSPDGDSILAVDQRQGLYRWEPGVDRNFREVLCYPFAEVFAGAGRTPSGDVWVAGLPNLRVNPDTPAIEVLPSGFLSTAAVPADGARDVAHDPMTDTLVFSVTGPTALKRYDPASGQVSDLNTPFAHDRVMVEPDGTIGTSSGTVLHRIDPTNLGNAQTLTDARYRFGSAIALGGDGRYVVVAVRTDGSLIEDLVEIDPASGAFTQVLSNLFQYTGPVPGPHGPIAVAPDGTIYVGHRADGDELFRVERSSGTPVVTRLSTVGSVTNPTTVTRGGLVDFVFMPAPVPSSADVSLVQTAASDPVVAGGTLTYSLVVQNMGPDTAAQVLLSDSLPAGATYAAAASDPACTASGSTVTCAVGDLPAGQSVMVRVGVLVSPSAAGTLVNGATATSATADPDTANNSVSAVTTVVSVADLGLSKTAHVGSVDVGTAVAYDLALVNAGPSDALGVVVSDPLPAGTIYDATSSSPSCAALTGIVTCALSTLPRGASTSLTIVLVPSQVGALVNTAEVASASVDFELGNNTSSAIVMVATPGTGENIDPAGTGEQYAYGENVGWLNLEPLGDGGPGVELRADSLSGWMWGESVGWCSLSCATTGTCATTNYGVNNDGAGRLAGWAWCENAGWLSFACENTASCGSSSYGVAIAPDDGRFFGNAWGENVGWISFGSTGPVPYGSVTSWRGAPSAARAHASAHTQEQP